MSHITQGIKSILSYKEPPDQPFELLEKDDEGLNQPVVKPDIEEIKKKYSKQEKKETIKPMKAGEVKAPRTPIDKRNVLTDELIVNIEYMKQRFNLPKNQDVIIREFIIGEKNDSCILFIAGMVDNNVINEFIIPPLINAVDIRDIAKESISDYILNNVISINQVVKTNNLDEITIKVLSGITALFIEGSDECLLIESRGFEKRSIDRPQTESVIRGSQEAFTEDLRTNLTLLRRAIKNENLIIEMTRVSKTNHASCAIAYLKDIASPELIKEVKRRVNNIDTDLILGAGMLEQLIEDNCFMLFPQLIDTERPDRAVSFLIEGKVLMIVDGTPFVMAAPITLFHLLHTSEDSLLRWEYGTFLRFIRYMGVLIALFLPGVYIALTLYHHEMIPTQLLISIVKTRQQVPFPAVMEMVMLEVAFELIREGGIRVPGVIGNTLGIVGALILGQAAVAAGLVSPILIIIAAVAGIGSFVIPNYSLSIGIRILRFIIILYGVVAGFFGISLAIVSISLIACNMKSFGVPFLSPIAPKTIGSHDLIIKYPVYMQRIRPDYFNNPDRSRQGPVARNWKNSKGGSKNDKRR